MPNFFRTQWSKTLTAPTTIANGTTLNLLTLINNATDKVANGCDTDYNALNIVTNNIIVPYQGIQKHTIRVNFDVGTGSSQSFLVQLRRTSDNSVISSVKFTRDNDNGATTVLFDSYTGGATDPFVTGGFYIAIQNNSGAALTLPTSSTVNVLITTSNR